MRIFHNFPAIFRVVVGQVATFIVICCSVRCGFAGLVVISSLFCRLIIAINWRGTFCRHRIWCILFTIGRGIQCWQAKLLQVLDLHLEHTNVIGADGQCQKYHNVYASNVHNECTSRVYAFRRSATD